MDDKMPADPITQLSTAVHQLHEFYEALQAAGFTKVEALELVKAAMSGPSRGK